VRDEIVSSHLEECHGASLASFFCQSEPRHYRGAVAEVAPVIHREGLAVVWLAHQNFRGKEVINLQGIVRMVRITARPCMPAGVSEPGDAAIGCGLP